METFTIRNGDQSNQAEIQNSDRQILTDEEFTGFLQKSQKHHPTMSILEHLALYVEYKEYLLEKNNYLKMKKEKNLSSNNN